MDVLLEDSAVVIQQQDDLLRGGSGAVLQNDAVGDCPAIAGTVHQQRVRRDHAAAGRCGRTAAAFRLRVVRVSAGDAAAGAARGSAGVCTVTRASAACQGHCDGQKHQALAQQSGIFRGVHVTRLALKVKTLASAPARYVKRRREAGVDDRQPTHVASLPGRQPRYLVIPIGPKTGGFASPPYDGFAFTLRGQLIQKKRCLQSVPATARRKKATRRRYAAGIGARRGCQKRPIRDKDYRLRPKMVRRKNHGVEPITHIPDKYMISMLLCIGSVLGMRPATVPWMFDSPVTEIASMTGGSVEAGLPNPLRSC